MTSVRNPTRQEGEITSNMSSTETPREAVHRIGEEIGADVYFASGLISRDAVGQLVREHGRSSKRDSCILSLTTAGGDPDAAYMMARYLKDAYKRFVVCVFGLCKSAGTLLALGADEIAMGVRGELGPLDIQITEKDELIRARSGVDIFMSLNVLQGSLFESFQHFFLQMVEASEGQITTRTASKIATELAVGLMAPISAQIDPARLGRERRALEITSNYAMRLGVHTKAIERLNHAYPSHTFVIDAKEASEFLETVRTADEVELELESNLKKAHIDLYNPWGDYFHVHCMTQSTEGDDNDGEPRTREEEEQQADEGSSGVESSTPPANEVGSQSVVNSER